MSTKIYVAYRLKNTDDLWPFIRDTYERGTENVKKVLYEFCQKIAGHIQEHGPHEDIKDVYDMAYESYRFVENEEERARKAVWKTAYEYMRDNYRKSTVSYQRDIFDFNVSITLREYEGSIYIIPYCDMMMRNALDFLKDDPRLEDYAYWDNTDPPDDVPYEEFEARGKVWDALSDQKLWRSYLTLDLCSWEKYWNLSPEAQDLARAFARMAKKKDTKNVDR